MEIGGIGYSRAEEIKSKGIDGVKEDIPIEVKQHSVRRQDVDAFETKLRRLKKDKDIMIGYGYNKDTFSTGAMGEIARAEMGEDITITPMYAVKGVKLNLNPQSKTDSVKWIRYAAIKEYRGKYRNNNK